VVGNEAFNQLKPTLQNKWTDWLSWLQTIWRDIGYDKFTLVLAE